MTLPDEPFVPGLAVTVSQAAAEDAAAAEQDSPAAKAARLRAEADALEAQATPGVVLLRVEPPHAAFTYGGTTVFDWPTPVNPLLVPGLMQSAAEAHVTLTQEG